MTTVLITGSLITVSITYEIIGLPQISIYCLGVLVLLIRAPTPPARIIAEQEITLIMTPFVLML
jgi:hypothetical protein